MGVDKKFDEISSDYDSQRRAFIPCFDDFYSTAVSMLDYKGNSPNVLDIGAGTGLCSAYILKRYPKAKLTLIDLSGNMLGIAKNRFKKHSGTNYIVADYTTYKFEMGFDIIISALSIHHLTAAEKADLFRKCYRILAKNGVFLNIDQALSPYKEVEDMFAAIWRQKVEESGLPREEIDKAYERVKYDKPSTAAEQLEWLKEAGFRFADIVYKYYHFCAFYAKK